MFDNRVCWRRAMHIMKKGGGGGGGGGGGMFRIVKELGNERY